jgi:hypothetical protein
MTTSEIIITKAAPKFLYNFTSTYGDTVHVEPLNDLLTFAVFGTKGKIGKYCFQKGTLEYSNTPFYLEIWRYCKTEASDDGANKEVNLFDILDIKMDGITFVQKIYADKPLHRDEVDEDSEVDESFEAGSSNKLDKKTRIRFKKSGIAHKRPEEELEQQGMPFLFHKYAELIL